jgi:transmembrane sensor
MQNKDFNTLIAQYLDDQLSFEEKLRLDNWLEHITDQSAADSLPDMQKEVDGKKIYNKLLQQIAATEKPAVPVKRLRLNPMLKVAASLFLCSSLVFGFRNQLQDLFHINRISSVSNTSGHITKSILSDGSIVWLKGNSKLNFPVIFKGGLRKVDLEGEALFEVAKDASHPFIISCGGLTTRVMGTSLNIKNAQNKIEVDVLTGRVYLSSSKTKALTLHPRQKAVYSALHETVVKATGLVTEVAAITKGTEYDMLFNDARVADVIRRIQDKFEVRINVEKSKLANIHITADFTDQSLENTMNMMSEALNLDFDIDGQSVHIINRNSNQSE